MTALAVLPDGHLVSKSFDGMLRMWDVDTGRILATLHGKPGLEKVLAVLPDGRLVCRERDDRFEAADYGRTTTLRSWFHW